MNKNYYNDLPNYIKKKYPNFYYNIYNKTLHIIQKNNYDLLISNIINMYELDNDFYIHSKYNLVLMWIDTKTYSILKKDKK